MRIKTVLTSTLLLFMLLFTIQGATATIWFNQTGTVLFEMRAEVSANNAFYASAYTTQAMCQGFLVIGNSSTYSITNITFPLNRQGGANWVTGTVVRAYILNGTNGSTPNITNINGDYGNNTFANSTTEIPSVSYIVPTNYTVNWNSGNPIVLNNTHYYACVDANGVATELWGSTYTGYYPDGVLFNKDGGWTIQTTDFLNMKVYGNGTEICSENWYCSLYDICNASNIKPCLAVNDSNICGTNFTGNLSDYDQNCTYLIPVTESSECDDSMWCMKGRYLNHTSWDGSSFQTIPCLNQANFSTGNISRSTPAIDRGYAYFASESGYVFQNNASNITVNYHSFYCSAGFDSSPVVVDDPQGNRVVLIGCFNGSVYKLNASDVSQVMATGDVDGIIGYSSFCTDNDSAYIGSDAGCEVKMNLTDLSIMASHCGLGSTGYSSCALTNHYIFFGSNDNRIYQDDKTDMTNIASYSTGNYVKSSPSILNGTCYWASYDHNAYQSNATNISLLPISNYTTGGEIFSSPTIPYPHDSVYIGSKADWKLWKLNITNISIKIADFTATDLILSTPLILPNGYVYFVSDAGIFYQNNASDLTYFTSQNFINGSGYASISSPSYAMGYTYVCSLNGYCYQYNASNISLPNCNLCTPNWTCYAYDDCNASNIMQCLNVYDNNQCEEEFTGNLSDYDIPCDYCTEYLVNYTTECENDTQYIFWYDMNFWECCNITGLREDCNILYTPYNETQRINCTTPTPETQMCYAENLTKDFNCSLDTTPILNDKMNIICELPDNQTYCCVVNTFQNQTLLATTPEYRTTNTYVFFNKAQEETRECYTPHQRLLNAYYTPKNLRTDTQYTLQVRCTSDNQTLKSEYCISPIYNKIDWWVNRTIWLKDNMVFVIIGTIFFFITIGIGIYIIRRLRFI